jgi:DNA-binding NarL/FixJ family response regulator
MELIYTHVAGLDVPKRTVVACVFTPIRKAPPTRRSAPLAPCGESTYLLKDADQDELVRAIHAVHRGEAIFSPAIAQRLIQYFAMLRGAPGGPGPHRAAVVAFPELTDREHEILHLIAQGHNNAGIATRLGISPKTVSNHISNIFSKLQVVDRAQAIVRAREAGLGHEGGR